MTVRTANFADIPQIVDIMVASKLTSRDAAITTFDDVEAKQLLVRCIQRHGHMNYMGSMVLVSENAEGLTGFVIGIFDQVYPCIKELKATDLLFLVTPSIDPRDTRKMVVSLVRWAESNPKCIKIMLGATDDATHWEVVGKLYEHAGLEQCGGIYRKDIDQTQQHHAEAI